MNETARASEIARNDARAGAALNDSVAYERRDVNARAIFWIGVVMIIAAVVIHTVVWWLFDAFDRREAQKGRPPATLVRAPQPAPTDPRLQTDAPADLDGLRAAKERELESYGWVDREKGVVHIPVEQAMTILVRRGLPKTQTPADESGAAKTNAQRVAKTNAQQQGPNR